MTYVKRRSPRECNPEMNGFLLAGRFMRHDWICYTTCCQSCGHRGLLQLWSDRQGWGYAAHELLAAAINRIHPENSTLRCSACSSSVIKLERQLDSPHCASAVCRFNRERSDARSSEARLPCPMHVQQAGLSVDR